MDKYTKICPVCGNEFGAKGLGPAYLAKRKYCSATCGNIASRKAKMATKICIECGDEYQIRDCPSITSAQKYCSRACRNKAHPYNGKKKVNPRAITEERICRGCNVVFVVPQSDKVVYCSRECYVNHRSLTGSTSEERKRIADLVCEKYPDADLDELSKELNISIGSIRTIAYKNSILRSDESIKSMYDATSERMADDNPMKRPEVVQKVSEFWQANPELKQKISVNATSKNQKDKPSKLELRCAEYLDELGLDYEHQAIIKDKFVVDFRLGNIILQCDGEYWHGHPRFEPLTERQQKQRKRDAAQDKYLTKCGYTVIRVWERDVTLETLRKLFNL